MKKIITLITILITLNLSGQQNFVGSEGDFYQVISGVLKAYDPVTGGYSEGLHTYSSYNAGGYNGADNYLYAIKKSDKHLLRIGKDMIVDLGAVVPSGTTVFGGGYAADVDAEGNLWVYQNNTKNAFHKITNLKDYDGSSSPVFEVIPTDVSSPSTCADIAFIDNAIYGGSRGKLYKWDLSTGTPVFSSKTVTNLPKSTFGAAYSDANKRLYLSDNNGGLYLINDYNSATPTATLLNLTETTNSNDGFKCADSASPLDRDQDGILDSMDADCDGDGILNIVECNGIDPFGDDDGDDLFNYLDNDFSGNGDNVVQDAFDRDGDGNPDFLDIDSDNDGIYDIVEAGQGDKDTNNDGICNGLDTDFQDTDYDGIADAFDQDQTGNALVLLDTDNDGIFDCYDTDSDNDGIVDIIEGQLSTAYIGLSNVDEDNDGLDDAFDPDYNGTTNGTINTDGTDNYDHLDTDSDNDGISDTIEAYDSDGDGVSETTNSGNDADQDGLDDNFDQRKTSFDPENGGQTPDSFPMPEICDRYNYLGDFSSDGTPLYLDERETISQETLDSINNALPEGYPVPDFNPHYISSGYDTDIIVQEQTDIWVTFVGEGAGYKNTLGFYTYDVNNPSPTMPAPEDITIVFPNVSAVGSGGGLQIGDKVNIGSFPANTGIGWVLLANAWSDGCVGTGNWQLYSNPDYNPESDASLRYHNVLLSDPNNEKILLGFEDIRRDYASCDQDFNDALFYITANPYNAIKTDNCASIDSATDVTSANDGGLESNGDLASLIAKRNFNRTKTNSIFNTKKSQKRFQPGKKSYKSANGIDLSVYFPKTGLLGTESTYVSSPEDLLGITNAEAVFSVDYYNGDERVAAALATATKGSIYDHSKTICDRLNGSKLLDVRTVNIRNQTIVSTKIERATGEIEYALTFSIKKTQFENEIYSLWNIGNYPEGDYSNFQVWGGSVSQVANLANHIIDTFTADKPLRSHKVNHRVPTVFVQQGSYAHGKLTLNIVNKFGATQMNFNGNIRKTELSDEENMIKEIALSGSYNEQVTIDAGYLFDIGFSITADDAAQSDALYLADGPWGIDFQKEGVVIESFEVQEQDTEQEENMYSIERNTIVEGEVKETLNLFRNILAGELTLDVTQYDAIQFEMQNSKDVEVILVTEGLTDWNNRLRYKVMAGETKTHTISFSDFTNGNKANDTIGRIKSVVFSVQGNYQSFEPFYLEVSDMAFTKANVTDVETDDDDVEEDDIEEDDIIAEVETIDEVKNFTLKNYPNPFSTQTTIQVPGTHKMLSITVIDLLGRTVRKEITNVNNNTINFESKNLIPGIYYYILRGQNKEQYKGRFLIQQ
ncbi:hypothetical protein AWE51_16010 [Aquimarina aggregata]|uniref:Secretion system C-terminal sorting domain-containing protein n=1 Tax=Aquimarina aggregata TaxID=1642818 RepID=A0A163CYW7_9FLAO|nr:DUF4114 domain-containing protein [Aquimarina aggregata]KZS42872.1 hypothetical protein AWE51_16010 [Aquimarina aggregata]